jgi:hypothetical protein
MALTHFLIRGGHQMQNRFAQLAMLGYRLAAEALPLSI